MGTTAPNWDTAGSGTWQTTDRGTLNLRGHHQFEQGERVAREDVMVLACGIILGHSHHDEDSRIIWSSLPFPAGSFACQIFPWFLYRHWLQKQKWKRKHNALRVAYNPPLNLAMSLENYSNYIEEQINSDTDAWTIPKIPQALKKKKRL